MAHFRLGAVGMSKPLYTHPKVTAVMERAHQTLDQTRGPLAVRENMSVYDGILHLRRLDASPEVQATFEFNPNGPASSTLPLWAYEAIKHLEGLRKVTTVGMNGAGRG